jgi:hypothetical protein
MNNLLRGFAVSALLVTLQFSNLVFADAVALITPSSEIIHPNLPRYGINLTGQSTWGAEQIRSNVFKNPGVEAVLDRSIFLVDSAQRRYLTEKNPWIARPDGFWAGAEYVFLTGEHAGEKGIVLDSTFMPASGTELSLDRSYEGVVAKDALSLKKISSQHAAPGWWEGEGKRFPSTEKPQSSTGLQSVRLAASSAESSELIHYLDAISERAGKLLRLDGQWRLSFWAKGSPGSRLHVHIDRASNTQIFLDETIEPTATWQQFHFAIDDEDVGKDGILRIRFRAEHNEVWLDDFYFGENESGVGGFRKNLVQALRDLNPGFIREWQGQLGESLENRLRDDLSRQLTRYKPGEYDNIQLYGLDDFFALCHEVGAQPWLIGPPTFSTTEWEQFGAYLRDAADRYSFSQVMVEFGNETWSTLFQGGSLPEKKPHIDASNRAFSSLRKGSNHDPRITTVNNAIFVYTDWTKLFGSELTHSDRIAIAPYFFDDLHPETTIETALPLFFSGSTEIFERQAAAAAAIGIPLSAYELNLHTTHGKGPTELRNQLVTSAASGAALAARLMEGTRHGLREQAVYSLLGFDAYTDNPDELVQLWGVLRDLNMADHYRATGYALKLMNEISGGRTSTLDCAGSCAQLNGLAFEKGLAIVNGAATTQLIRLDCPSTTREIRYLDGSAPIGPAGSKEKLGIRSAQVTCEGGYAEFPLPAYSLLISPDPQNAQTN